MDIKFLLKKSIIKLPAFLRLSVLRNYYKYFRYSNDLRHLNKFCNSKKLSIDIGANVGKYTIFLMNLSKTVICFEANPLVCDYLNNLFRGKNVKIINFGLGSKREKLYLKVPYAGSQMLHGLASFKNDFKNVSWKEKMVTNIKSIAVEIRPLDEFKFENIGFIKIDVEGFEEEVLLGAEKTIAKNKPNILIELEERHHVNIYKVFEKLISMGYKGYFCYHKDLIDISNFDINKFQVKKAPDKSKDYVNNFYFTICS